MKTLILKFLFAVLLMMVWAACGHKEHRHEHSSEVADSSNNEALYDEVMKIHDEVMPKMGDIYKAKEELKKQLETMKDLTTEKKQEIESAIAKLDSANQSMMDWMHKFKPLPDSVGEEKVREYLETEMEKIKKVREDIKEALSKND